jgi:Ca-activated chloride channel family protein
MIEDKRKGAVALLLAGALVLAGTAMVFGDAPDPAKPGGNGTEGGEGGVDDWQYSPDEEDSSGGGGLFGAGGSAQTAPSGGSADAAAPSGGSGVGFSAGGAKDINNFRDNIENGYLPIPTDLQYEGLFYDYYFDTGQTQDCDDLFCPSYSTAVSEDPLSSETDRYMTVGLNSGLEEVERKKLNTVVVLDISGSMGSSFDEYYYDRFGNRQEVENYTGDRKIEVATDVVASMTEHLNEDDRFGMVVFNGDAAVAKPVNEVGETDMEAIRGHIRELQAGGGTRMSAGMAEATRMLRNYTDADQSEYENRMVFMTDAMPNLGDTDDDSLLGRMEENAEDSIHTTFVGMGVDFNTEIVEEITSVRGANYFSVHSAEQFENRMDENFEYMVTPLVYNLELEVESDGYDIEKVYGSTAADEATGEIMKVNTLFPSPKKDGETKGGVVLVKLEKQGEDSNLELEASWENRQGETDSTTKQVSFTSEEPDAYDNAGIRKAVVLTRYADLMKNWMVHESDGDKSEIDVSPDGSIAPPPDLTLGEWERQSQELTVSSPYDERIQEFAEYFEDEMEALDDDSLQKELDMLNRLGGT